MTAWNDFVKKIYHEGHNKDKSYSFKQALKDASARKNEMRSYMIMTKPTKHVSYENKKTRKHKSRRVKKSQGTKRRTIRHNPKTQNKK